MFCKKQKKEIPKGVFIPTQARVLIIIHLCLVFTVLAWDCLQPFLGDYYKNKSSLLLFESILDINPKENVNLAESPYLKLPEDKKKSLMNDYLLFKKKLDLSFFERFKKFIIYFTNEISPLKLLWIFFSVTISIMILKRVEGASQAIWLLPVITLLYGYENLAIKNPQPNEEEKLFPSEEIIYSDYLKEPKSNDVLKQYEQLKRGWDLYLIQNYGDEIPSQQTEQYKKQLKQAQFAFNVKRLEKRMTLPKQTSKEPVLFFMFYLIWNFYLAWFVNKKLKQELKNFYAKL